MNNRPRSRRILVVAAISAAVIAAFFAGGFLEHFRRGRWYELHDDQTWESRFGTVHLRHVTDTQGWPFLDTGDSVITLEDASGLDVKLYQSKRVFQEEWPWVDGVQVEGDRLKWSDGVSRYTLQIEPIAPTTRP